MSSQPLKMPAAKAKEENTDSGSTPNPETPQADKMPADLNRRLRSLAHDLSNSVETIMQACYLLGQAKLAGNGAKWVELADNAAQDAARINRSIREILRSQK